MKEPIAKLVAYGLGILGIWVTLAGTSQATQMPEQPPMPKEPTKSEQAPMPKQTAMPKEPNPAIWAEGLIVQNCLSCHHSEVYGLSHLTPSQISEKLVGFKTGKIHATIMDRITAPFSIKDLERIATLISEISEQGQVSKQSDQSPQNPQKTKGEYQKTHREKPQ